MRLEDTIAQPTTDHSVRETRRAHQAKQIHSPGSDTSRTVRPALVHSRAVEESLGSMPSTGAIDRENYQLNSQDAASDEFGAQTPADTCAELLGKLFPRPVGVATMSFNGANYPLFPGEENAVAGAVEKRRREFAAGRYCARCALSQLGFPTVAIPSAPDRSPVWPAGALGSVSHDSSLCFAVAARRTAFRSIGWISRLSVQLVLNWPTSSCGPTSGIISKAGGRAIQIGSPSTFV
ncbi:hypothetical protein ACVWZM_004559 [Bradyrhizobium sp. USDA 4501]